MGGGCHDDRVPPLRQLTRAADGYAAGVYSYNTDGSVAFTPATADDASRLIERLQSMPKRKY